MLFGLIGRTTSAPQLKESLDVSAQRTRAIAHRVAGATVAGQSGFALPGAGGQAAEAVDLEAEMTALADEQLRYEATAKLLEKTYTRLRLSIRQG